MAAAPGYEYETLAVTWLSDGVMSVSPPLGPHASVSLRAGRDR